jgi:hypothetical protein
MRTNCRTCRANQNSSKQKELFSKLGFNNSEKDSLELIDYIRDFSYLRNKIKESDKFTEFNFFRISQEQINKFSNFFYQNSIDSSFITFIEIFSSFNNFLNFCPINQNFEQIFLSCFFYVMKSKHSTKITDPIIEESFSYFNIQKESMFIVELRVFIYLKTRGQKDYFVDFLLYVSDLYFHYISTLRKKKKGIPKRRARETCEFKRIAVLLCMKFYLFLLETNTQLVNESPLSDYLNIFFVVINFLSSYTKGDQHYIRTIFLFLEEELKINISGQENQLESLFIDFMHIKYDLI